MSEKAELVFPDALKAQLEGVLRPAAPLLAALGAAGASATGQIAALLGTPRCSGSVKQALRAVLVNAVQLVPAANGAALGAAGLVPEVLALVADAPSATHARAALQALDVCAAHCGADAAALERVAAACAACARDADAAPAVRVGALEVLAGVATRGRAGNAAAVLARAGALACFPEVLVAWAGMPGRYADGVFARGQRQCLAALNALYPAAPAAVLAAPALVPSVVGVVEAHAAAAPEAVAFLLTLSTAAPGRAALAAAEPRGASVLAAQLPLYEDDAVRCNMVRVLTNVCVDDAAVRALGERGGVLACVHDTLAHSAVDSPLWECAARCANNVLAGGLFDDAWAAAGGLATLVRQLRRAANPAVVAPLLTVVANMLLASDRARRTLVAEHGVRTLVALADSPAPAVAEQAVRALGNLCAAARDARRAVHAHAGLPALLRAAARHAAAARTAAYAAEALVSATDCPPALRRLAADPPRAAELLAALAALAADPAAPPALRAHALDALGNTTRAPDIRVMFLQNVTPKPLLDILRSVAATHDDDKDGARLMMAVLNVMTNLAADGRMRLWFRSLDAEGRGVLDEVVRGAPEGSELRRAAERTRETLSFACEARYEHIDFEAQARDKKKQERRERKRKAREDAVALEQMDLETLQQRAEEQEKVTSNAQIAFDFAQQDTARAKKQCQHEKKKLAAAQKDHAQQLEDQRRANEALDREQERVAVPAEQEAVRARLVREFEDETWPAVADELRSRRAQPAALAAEEAQMRRELAKRIAREQEQCVLRNEVRKEHAATALHIQKMRFLMDERTISQTYHSLKYKYAKCEEDEKEAAAALEKQNARLAKLVELIERVEAAQRAEAEAKAKEQEEAKKTKEGQKEQKGAEEEEKSQESKDAEAAAQKAKEEQEEKAKKQHQRRTFIVTEICDTEENYVNGLTHALTVYRAPLLDAVQRGKKAAILTREQIDAIFANMETIRDYNAVFLDILKSRLAQWGPCTEIGDTFLVISRLLLSYTEYVNNYSRAIDTLGKLRAANAAFGAFMDDADNEDVNLKLVSILIFPIQRVPRYILLIQDLLKHTNADHPDYRNLEQALDAMNKTGTSINESKREAENTSKLAEINSSLKGKHPAFQRPGRYFLSETPVTLAPAAGSSSKAASLHGMLYISTDMLLVTHAVGRGLSQYEGALDLAQSTSAKSAQVAAALDLRGPCAVFADPKDQKRYAKTDKKTGAPEQQHFVLVLKSLPDANRWLSKIEAARRDIAKTPASPAAK